VILILLIGLILVGVAFGLFARTLLLPRFRAAEGLRQINVYGFKAAPAAALAEHRESAGRRLPRLGLSEGLDAVAGKVGGKLAGRGQGMSEENLRRLLLAAGFYTLPPRRFAGYQALSTLFLGVFFVWVALAGSSNPALSLVMVLIGVLVGWSLPLVYIRRRARMRAEQIDFAMPDLIDMLVATVEAGIAFSASLQLASQRFRGPLGDELRLTLQEHSMGLGLNQALNNMLERQNTQTVRSFVRALIQGEQLGVSVGQTLRNLSYDMRTLRRQLAEERAQKAPVKLVFPVVLLIFPALLVIVLGPAALTIRAIFH
jgi:tight adherence protein C